MFEGVLEDLIKETTADAVKGINKSADIFNLGTPELQEAFRNPDATLLINPDNPTAQWHNTFFDPANNEMIFKPTSEDIESVLKNNPNYVPQGLADINTVAKNLSEDTGLSSPYAMNVSHATNNEGLSQAINEGLLERDPDVVAAKGAEETDSQKGQAFAGDIANTVQEYATLPLINTAEAEAVHKPTPMNFKPFDFTEGADSKIVKGLANDAAHRIYNDDSVSPEFKRSVVNSLVSDAEDVTPKAQPQLLKDLGYGRSITKPGANLFEILTDKDTKKASNPAVKKLLEEFPIEDVKDSPMTSGVSSLYPSSLAPFRDTNFLQMDRALDKINSGDATGIEDLKDVLEMEYNNVYSSAVSRGIRNGAGQPAVNKSAMSEIGYATKNYSKVSKDLAVDNPKETINKADETFNKIKKVADSSGNKSVIDGLPTVLGTGVNDSWIPSRAQKNFLAPKLEAAFGDATSTVNAMAPNDKAASKKLVSTVRGYINNILYNTPVGEGIQFQPRDTKDLADFYHTTVFGDQATSIGNTALNNNINAPIIFDAEGNMTLSKETKDSMRNIIREGNITKEKVDSALTPMFKNDGKELTDFVGDDDRLAREAGYTDAKTLNNHIKGLAKQNVITPEIKKDPALLLAPSASYDEPGKIKWFTRANEYNQIVKNIQAAEIIVKLSDAFPQIADLNSRLNKVVDADQRLAYITRSNTYKALTGMGAEPKQVPYVGGDITTVHQTDPNAVIVNPVNIVGVMGAGLAKTFKSKFPKYFKAYAEDVKNGELAMGKPSFYNGDEGKIISFPTKNHYRDKSNIEDIVNGLEYFVRHYKEYGSNHFVFPPLGAGLGGLPKDAVIKRMRSILQPLMDEGVNIEIMDNEGGSSGVTRNIWHSSGENKNLSNLAPRPFTYNDIPFNSVEHAYQSLKSGEFHEPTYEAGKAGGKVVLPSTPKADNETNINLMEDLIRESFKQNPGAAKELIDTGDDTLTHIQDKGIWKEEFPKALMRVRDELSGKAKTVKEVMSEANSDDLGIRKLNMTSSSGAKYAKKEGTAGGTFDQIRHYGDAVRGDYDLDSIQSVYKNAYTGALLLSDGKPIKMPDTLNISADDIKNGRAISEIMIRYANRHTDLETAAAQLKELGFLSETQSLKDAFNNIMAGILNSDAVNMNQVYAPEAYGYHTPGASTGVQDARVINQGLSPDLRIKSFATTIFGMPARNIDTRVPQSATLFFDEAGNLRNPNDTLIESNKAPAHGIKYVNPGVENIATSLKTGKYLAGDRPVGWLGRLDGLTAREPNAVMKQSMAAHGLLEVAGSDSLNSNKFSMPYHKTIGKNQANYFNEPTRIISDNNPDTIYRQIPTIKKMVEEAGGLAEGAFSDVNRMTIRSKGYNALLKLISTLEVNDILAKKPKADGAEYTPAEIEPLMKQVMQDVSKRMQDSLDYTKVDNAVKSGISDLVGVIPAYKLVDAVNEFKETGKIKDIDPAIKEHLTNIYSGAVEAAAIPEGEKLLDKALEHMGIANDPLVDLYNKKVEDPSFRLPTTLQNKSIITEQLLKHGFYPEASFAKSLEKYANSKAKADTNIKNSTRGMLGADFRLKRSEIGVPYRLALQLLKEHLYELADTRKGESYANIIKDAIKNPTTYNPTVHKLMNAIADSGIEVGGVRHPFILNRGGASFKLKIYSPETDVSGHFLHPGELDQIAVHRDNLRMMAGDTDGDPFAVWLRHNLAEQKLDAKKLGKIWLDMQPKDGEQSIPTPGDEDKFLKQPTVASSMQQRSEALSTGNPLKKVISGGQLGDDLLGLKWAADTNRFSPEASSVTDLKNLALQTVTKATREGSIPNLDIANKIEQEATDLNNRNYITGNPDYNTNFGEAADKHFPFNHENILTVKNKLITARGALDFLQTKDPNGMVGRTKQIIESMDSDEPLTFTKPFIGISEYSPTKGRIADIANRLYIFDKKGKMPTGVFEDYTSLLGGLGFENSAETKAYIKGVFNEAKKAELYAKRATLKNLLKHPQSYKMFSNSFPVELRGSTKGEMELRSQGLSQDLIDSAQEEQLDNVVKQMDRANKKIYATESKQAFKDYIENSIAKGFTDRINSESNRMTPWGNKSKFQAKYNNLNDYANEYATASDEELSRINSVKSAINSGSISRIENAAVEIIRNRKQYDMASNTIRLPLETYGSKGEIYNRASSLSLLSTMLNNNKLKVEVVPIYTEPGGLGDYEPPANQRVLRKIAERAWMEKRLKADEEEAPEELERGNVSNLHKRYKVKPLKEHGFTFDFIDTPQFNTYTNMPVTRQGKKVNSAEVKAEHPGGVMKKVNSPRPPSFYPLT